MKKDHIVFVEEAGERPKIVWHRDLGKLRAWVAGDRKSLGVGYYRITLKDPEGVITGDHMGRIVRVTFPKAVLRPALYLKPASAEALGD